MAVDDGNAGDAVTESGVVAGDPSATGNVLTNDIDPDSGDTKAVIEVNGAAINVGQPLVGTYGTLTLLADGSWTYALNDADPDTDALAQGQLVTHVVTYTVSDANGATSTARLTITITGGNDAPVVTGAVDSGEVTEASQPVLEVDGTIDFGDVDLNDAHVTSVTPGGAGYVGTFVANVTNASTGDGIGQVTWLFAVNNALREGLGAGEVLVQTYTVGIADGHGGTASQLVTITINGTNDAAVITGDSIGAVVEAGGVDNAIPGTPVDSGDLDSTDVDDADDAWDAVGSQTASANGYGTFTITGAGVWTYTLDNSNAAVQAVAFGGSLADSFTVATTDGTSQVVSITITGANDAPVAVDDGNGADAVTDAGVTGAVHAAVVSLRYAVRTLRPAVQTAVTRPMPSTAARSRSWRSSRPAVLPEICVVVPALHWRAQPAHPRRERRRQPAVLPEHRGAAAVGRDDEVGDVVGERRSRERRLHAPGPAVRTVDRVEVVAAGHVTRVRDGDVAGRVALDVRAVGPRRRDRLDRRPCPAERPPGGRG